VRPWQYDPLYTVLFAAAALALFVLVGVAVWRL
jgi:hypothetical protein